VYPHCKSRLAALCALLVLALGIPLLGQQDVHATLIAWSNRKPAPSFDLASETGKSVRIPDYRGKVVLLNFWATDCGGCVLEIPSFVALQSAYQAKGFTAVGISMDISYENLKNAAEAWAKVKPFASSHRMNYPILMLSPSRPRLSRPPDVHLAFRCG
jgi:thiol-disulfide isomerase/thioredoxin